MKKVLLLFIFFVLIIPQVHAARFMDNAMDSWIGYSIDDVIQYWGYPDTEKKIAGRKLFYWNHSNYTISEDVNGIYSRKIFCNRILEVDKKNIIISWQYEGNSCPLFYFAGKKLVNPQNNIWKKKKEMKRSLKEKRKMEKTEK